MAVAIGKEFSINTRPDGLIYTEDEAGLPVTALSTAAAALNPGDSTIFATSWTGGDIPTNDDWNWNNKFLYDPVNQIAFSSTKRAGADTNMTQAFYDEVANVWLSENCGYNVGGHTYDMVAYDPIGRGWTCPGGGQDNRCWSVNWLPGQALGLPTPGTSSALADPDTSGYMASSGNFTQGGEVAMDWHPNLYGPGDGGLIVYAHRGLIAWRAATDDWSAITPLGETVLNPGVPAVVYDPTLDQAMCTNASGNRAYLVTDATTWVRVSDTPVRFGPDAGGQGGAAKIISDPTQSGVGWYALGDGGSTAGRVYKYNAGNWDLQGYTHPFGSSVTDEDWECAAIYGMGVFWGLERQSGSNPARSRLWRPND